MQSQDVKGKGGIEEPLGNSPGSRVGVLVLVRGVRREGDGELSGFLIYSENAFYSTSQWIKSEL